MSCHQHQMQAYHYLSFLGNKKWALNIYNIVNLKLSSTNK